MAIPSRTTNFMILCWVLCSATSAQSTERPQFDVATRSPDQTQRKVVRTLQGGRLTATAPVTVLIQSAFSLAPFQIVGGPSWVQSDRYDIEAKVDGNPSKEQLLLMLRSLLEDRFQLKTRREKREMAVYDLVATKNGPKLPVPKEGVCVPDGPAPPSAAGPPSFFRCGHILNGTGESSAVMNGGNVVMAELAKALSVLLNRPVIDRTGFVRSFDLKLTYGPDMSTPSSPSSADGVPSDQAAPSIFVALQEQLGLKLESSKGTVEVLVIGSVERPKAN